MKLVIRFSAKEEARALPLLLRHSVGMVLPGRTYVVSPAAAEKLRAEGIKFTELSSEVHAPSMKELEAGESV